MSSLLKSTRIFLHNDFIMKGFAAIQCSQQRFFCSDLKPEATAKADNISENPVHHGFDESLMKYIVCPLTKTPLRYDKTKQLLVNDELSIGYTINNGIPNMLPTEAVKLEKMSVNNQKECGCKGIRTCLICEKSLDKKHAGLEGVIEYKYCHLCNLCWRVNENGVLNHSDHIGESFCLEGIRVVPEFVSTEEEKFLVSNIDQISWRPSQSGRRKQDFGPKVNFKKQKVKAGSFNGFPQFSGEILLRLNQVSDLYSFRPVELCNLEYCPERGSAIDPHLDDSWLWGERLVTLNLLSETVLTLSPTETNDSKRSQCFHKATDVGSTEHSFVNCTHFDNNLQKVTSDNWNVDPLCGLYKKDVACNNLKAQLVRDTKEDHSHPNINCCDLESLVENHGDMVSLNGTKQIEKSLSALNLKYVDHSQHILNQIKILIRINLPPRSLLVLSGCARHHWYHAINREDITSRRLAMTFRELSLEFLEGGKEWNKGKELLDLAKISDECN